MKLILPFLMLLCVPLAAADFFRAMVQSQQALQSGGGGSPGGGGGGSSWYYSLPSGSIANEFTIDPDTVYSTASSQISLPSGHVTQLAFYGEVPGGAGDEAWLGLYNSSLTLIASNAVAVAAGTSLSYITVTVSSTAVSAGNYVVAFQDNSGNIQLGFGSSGSSYSDTDASFQLPPTLPQANNHGASISLGVYEGP